MAAEVDADERIADVIHRGGGVPDAPEDPFISWTSTALRYRLAPRHLYKGARRQAAVALEAHVFGEVDDRAVGQTWGDGQLGLDLDPA